MTNEELADRLFQRVESMVAKAIGPVVERLESLETLAIPTASEVAKTILGGDEMQTLVELYVTEAVSQIEPIKGDPGENGKDGADGRPGLDVKDLFRAEGGRLVAVLSDGTTKDLGQFVGKDGRDGKDGAGLVDLVRSYNADTHEIVEVWGEKELRYPAGGIRPGGYWREGTKAVAAQVWNHAGVAWIAKRDTTDKPMRESKDWEIFANKGRDGDNGKHARDLGPAPPVKLHG